MDVYNNSNPFIFGIPYDDIQSCDITTVLSALNSFLESRERVVFGRGRFTLPVEGYDDDPRDVWEGSSPVFQGTRREVSILVLFR